MRMREICSHSSKSHSFDNFFFEQVNNHILMPARCRSRGQWCTSFWHEGIKTCNSLCTVFFSFTSNAIKGQKDSAGCQGISSQCPQGTQNHSEEERNGRVSATQHHHCLIRTTTRRGFRYHSYKPVSQGAQHTTQQAPQKARLVRLDIDLCLTRGFFFLLELIINDVTLNSVNVTGQDTMKTMGLLPLDRNKQASSSEEVQGWTLQLSVRCDASSAIGHSTLPEGRRRTQAGE